MSVKVQVNIKIPSNKEASSTMLDLTVNEEDTVQCIKERVAAAQLIAFPEQDLVLDGKVLENGCKLTDCGVKEGSSLDFVVAATVASLVKQLSELLQARDLSCDELGLLYCYKHGVSVKQALKLIGHDEKFQDFVKEQKQFSVENGRVALLRADTSLKPFSVADEVKQLLEATPTGSMEITALCAKFVQKFNVSIASIAGMRPTDFLAKERVLFSVNGRGTITLKSKIQGRFNVERETAARTPSPKAASPVPVNVEPKAAAEEASETAVQNQQYVDLHTKICGRAFTSKVSQALHDVVATIKDNTFLSIEKVVKGGSVGKGAAITGVEDAEVTLFLNGLPTTNHKWQPALLNAIAGGLQDRLADGSLNVEEIQVTSDSVRVRTKGLEAVDIRLSPVFKSYDEVIETIAKEGPASRKFYKTALAEEHARFIEKQAGPVKMTIRLLKWWREQQQWSSPMTKPSDEILELLAVYSAAQTKPADQRLAVANVMALLARFNELRIVWPSYYYSKDDIWAPLLNQRPLLMDPTNQFVNVADPQAFDASEMMAVAKSTHFFW